MLTSTEMVLRLVILLTATQFLISAQECNSNTGVCHDAGTSCQDNEKYCSFWSENNECAKNPTYMHKNCAKSCNTCDTAGSSRATTSTNDPDAAESIVERSATFGEMQEAIGPEKEEVLQRLRETIRYMESEEVTQLSPQVLDLCKNKNKLCTYWSLPDAVDGNQCVQNKIWMDENCGPACQSCDNLDFNNRCPKLENPTPALKPGDLNQMFERIIKTAPGNRTDITPAELEELEQSKTPMYTVHVHSKPPKSAIPMNLGAHPGLMEQFSRPWVVTFDNFLTDDECEALISAGYNDGFKRSMAYGEVMPDGTVAPVLSTSRTSETAWCSSEEGGCRRQEVPKRIHDRISRVLDIPLDNMELIQFLKYEKGQFYTTHHDYVPIHKDRQCGPRILTFFLYLSDVEEGGGTNFPTLGITVTPKKGRALLWPSVYHFDLTMRDARTTHQALPVIEGTKFAANVWVHLYDFMTPSYQRCN